MQINLKYKVAQPYDRGLMQARGIAKEDVIDFIHPTSRLLQDPFALENMPRAIELVKQMAGKRTLLLVDSDADGFCSASIIFQYLGRVFPDWEIDVALHVAKQHGLEGLKGRYNIADYDFIILPDAGTNDDEYMEKTPETKFLVLDHHLREGEEEVPSNAVIVNNQTSPQYKNKSLSGAGVTWQFCRAYDKQEGLEYAYDYVDLAAISIVADIMDLSQLENRYIVSTGIARLNNLFLRRLQDDAAFQLGDKPLTPIGAAFYMIPNINAMCRMGTMEEKERMWLAFVDPNLLVQSKKRGAQEGEMVPVVTEAIRESRNVKARQKRMQEKMAELCEKRVVEEDLEKDKIMIITLDDTFDEMPPELNGLTATKIANEKGRPVLIGRVNEYGELKGSIRGLPRVGIPSLKGFLESSGYMNWVSGHSNAAGFSLPHAKLDELKDWIVNNTPHVEIGTNVWDVDFEFDAFDDELKEAIKELDAMQEFWGQGFPEPLISIRDIRVRRPEIQVLGKKADTVKLTCNGVAYMFFRRSEEEVRELIAHDSVTFNIVGRANLNRYFNSITPQIFVTDYTMKNTELEF